jgi:hypothetical protein
MQMKARRVTEQDEFIAAVTANAESIHNCYLTATASRDNAKHTAAAAAAAATVVVSLDTLLPVRKGSVRGAAPQRALLYSTAVAKCIHTSLTTASTVTNISTSSSGSILDSGEKLSQQIRALTRKLSVAAVGHGPTVIAASRRALLNKCFPILATANDTRCDKVTAATITATAGTAIATATEDAVTAKCDSATATAATGSANATSSSVVRRGFNRECWYRLEHVLPLDAAMHSELALLTSCYANATSDSNSSSGSSSAVLNDDSILAAVDAQIGVKGGCMAHTHTGITDQYLYRSLYALQLHRCTR